MAITRTLKNTEFKTTMQQQLLMIEDDARLANMVSEYLRQGGFEVAHAPDGTAANAAGFGGAGFDAA
jgi:CheY-like chemotaxis protein